MKKNFKNTTKIYNLILYYIFWWFIFFLNIVSEFSTQIYIYIDFIKLRFLTKFGNKYDVNQIVET